MNLRLKSADNLINKGITTKEKLEDSYLFDEIMIIQNLLLKEPLVKDRHKFNIKMLPIIEEMLKKFNSN